MCREYVLNMTASELTQAFELQSCPSFNSPYCAIPFKPAFAIRAAPSGKLAASMLRWGLVPVWATDLDISKLLVNAPADCLSFQPAFRNPFLRQRCILPATSFRPGGRSADGNECTSVRLETGGVFGIAGLWDSCRLGTGQVVESVTLVTVDATVLLQPRQLTMPAILSPSDYQAWLRAETPEDEVSRILRRPSTCALVLENVP